MKGILWIIIAGTLSLGQFASAQQDTLRRGSMHLKTIRIIGNDTIVDERHIDLDGNLPNNPETFRMPDPRRWGGYIPMRQPSFSVEDVAIYPEKNSVKNFYIKPLPGTTVLLVEADLDNKRSVYTVYDQLGRTIHQEKIARLEGEFRRVLDMAEMKSGTYFVEIKNGKSTKKKRLTLR